MIGGDIDVIGGGIIAGEPSGTAIGGRIELGSVASPSQVSLNSTQQGLTLKYDGVEHFGNIALNAADGFLVTVPNEDSDIVANAFIGQGGNISLTTQGNFGIEARRSLQDNGTNDISASSAQGVAGTVILHTPNVDPIRGTTVLPAMTTVPGLVQGCQVSGGQSTAEFFNTGRGGLPPTPYEPLSSADILDDVRISGQNNSSSTSPNFINFIDQNFPSSATVEANGWVRGENGKIMLRELQ